MFSGSTLNFTITHRFQDTVAIYSEHDDQTSYTEYSSNDGVTIYEGNLNTFRSCVSHKVVHFTSVYNAGIYAVSY